MRQVVYKSQGAIQSILIHLCLSGVNLSQCFKIMIHTLDATMRTLSQKIKKLRTIRASVTNNYQLNNIVAELPFTHTYIDVLQLLGVIVQTNCRTTYVSILHFPTHIIRSRGMTENIGLRSLSYSLKQTFEKLLVTF